MLTTLKRYSPGLALTLLLAIAATRLAKLPYVSVLGSLTFALILGIAWRSFFGLPETAKAGTTVSGKKLLRAGIVRP